MSHLDWGTVPAWVAAVIASISAAVALTSYLWSQYDKKREQASKVSCRVEIDYGHIKTIESLEGIRSTDIPVDINIANRSNASVYDLEVTFPERRVEPFQLNELPPGDCSRKMHLWKKHDVPETSLDESQPAEYIADETPTLTFTDALDRRWRKRKGRIRRARQQTKLIKIVLAKPDDQGLQAEFNWKPVDTNKDKR
jgi:hypothetical protein